MKATRWAAALVVATLGLAEAAHAQFMTNEWVITAGGGLSDPTGVFEEQMKFGPSAIVSVGRHFNPSWMLGLRAGMFPFKSEDAWIAKSSQTEILFWTLEVDARLMLYPESWFTPYLVLGGGGAQEIQTYAEASGERHVTVIRGIGSGGLGISMHSQGKPLSFFTEFVYQHLPSDNGSRQWLRWTTGLRFSIGGRPF